MQSCVVVANIGFRSERLISRSKGRMYVAKGSGSFVRDWLEGYNTGPHSPPILTMTSSNVPMSASRTSVRSPMDKPVICQRARNTIDRHDSQNNNMCSVDSDKRYLTGSVGALR